MVFSLTPSWINALFLVELVPDNKTSAVAEC